MRAGPGGSLCESNAEQPDGADSWSFTNWTSPVSGVETKAKMMPEPLKSALSIGDVEDTSLALPSDHELRSAQQRVLEQVHTIKRSKSKNSSKSVSGLSSPTSPESDSVFYDFKFSPGASLSGPSFSKGGTMTNGTMQRQGFVRQSTNSRSSSGQRVTSGSGNFDRSFYSATGTLPAQTRTNNQLYSYNTTRSAPDLGFQSTGNVGATAATLRTQTSRQILTRVPTTQPAQAYGNSNVPRMPNSNQASTMQRTMRRPSSLQSNGESRVSMIRTGQAKDISGMNAEKLMADMTMQDAVDYLFSTDESYQLCGAAYIQHSTFTDDKAKQEVLTLKGIPPLVNLLNSPSPQVQETVAAALRNLVFKNQANKEEVQRCRGITQVVQLLGKTNSETQKHLTGLLWNLSSADNLKLDLLHTALPALTEKVIEPFSASTDDNSNTSLAPEVFNNATACLRNLSASKPANRQAMRNCKGLIDSLMRYTENCVNAGTPDDQSLENCVCILHNLTYQLETEMPSLFTKINMLASYARNHSSSSDAGPIGCFSSQSQKLQQESGFDYPVMEDNNPKGAGWLFHSKALQMYLNLLSSSERDATLEASCGVLQNLTATDGLVSNVLSHTIVQKLNGLKYISPLLQSPNPALQNSAVALLGNLSRSTRTNKTMARQTLPQLVGFLNSGLMKGDSSTEYDSTMATALHNAHGLMKADPEISKSLLNNSLINSLNNMSLNLGLPKSSTAAGVLLHSLWSEKNIQSFLKKQGMNKKSFVNDITSAAFKSLQVVD
ncbi:plakophilin-1-like isoform X2 [Sinocyclocheilus anshuiensis]|uniref:plakophilin-1-like isoform X2 n=1 Tax=Sinocyclocheilus anshuiensis TaxID=1608454 RepID=UPI0007B7E7D9|nr:PREDICTED: plakophilin-1-like isoform X2 [Sinocyclocheilus anshuiensis]